MAFLRCFCSALVALAISGCGIDVVGVAEEPFEAGSPPPTAIDAGADAPAPVRDAGSDVASPPACDDSPCAPLGQKWKPVAVAIGAAPVACPGADGEVLRTDPVAESGACSCRATNPVPPVCHTGLVTFKVGTGCNGTGVQTNSNSSTCHALAGTLASSVMFTALAPTGGSCGAESVADPTKITSSALTLCPASCRGDVCAKRAPAGFRACIVADGDVDCDVAGFTEKHPAGTPSLTCSDCTCKASATCTNVSIDLFTNGACGTKVFSLPANACTNTGSASGDGIGGMIYNATVNPTYQATGPLTPSVGLSGPRTVCCAP